MAVSSHTPLRGYSSAMSAAEQPDPEFQVIPPCGGILAHVSALQLSLRFKSYPLAGVFDPITLRMGTAIEFPVIPPCGGSPAPNAVEWINILVSSHTPLRGYSSWYSCGQSRSLCFKSYPLAGVFAAEIEAVIGGVEFQVIPPCGGIQILKTLQKRLDKVSSHTPLRGYSHAGHRQL